MLQTFPEGQTYDVQFDNNDNGQDSAEFYLTNQQNVDLNHLNNDQTSSIGGIDNTFQFNNQQNHQHLQQPQNFVTAHSQQAVKRTRTRSKKNGTVSQQNELGFVGVTGYSTVSGNGKKAKIRKKQMSPYEQRPAARLPAHFNRLEKQAKAYDLSVLIDLNGGMGQVFPHGTSGQPQTINIGSAPRTVSLKEFQRATDQMNQNFDKFEKNRLGKSLLKKNSTKVPNKNILNQIDNQAYLQHVSQLPLTYNQIRVQQTGSAKETLNAAAAVAVTNLAGPIPSRPQIPTKKHRGHPTSSSKDGIDQPLLSQAIDQFTTLNTNSVANTQNPAAQNSSTTALHLGPEVLLSHSLDSSKQPNPEIAQSPKKIRFASSTDNQRIETDKQRDLGKDIWNPVTANPGNNTESVRKAHEKKSKKFMSHQRQQKYNSAYREGDSSQPDPETKGYSNPPNQNLYKHIKNHQIAQSELSCPVRYTNMTQSAKFVQQSDSQLKNLLYRHQNSQQQFFQFMERKYEKVHNEQYQQKSPFNHLVSSSGNVKTHTTNSIGIFDLKKQVRRNAKRVMSSKQRIKQDDSLELVSANAKSQQINMSNQGYRSQKQTIPGPLENEIGQPHFVPRESHFEAQQNPSMLFITKTRTSDLTKGAAGTVLADGTFGAGAGISSFYPQNEIRNTINRSNSQTDLNSQDADSKEMGTNNRKQQQSDASSLMNQMQRQGHSTGDLFTPMRDQQRTNQGISKFVKKTTNMAAMKDSSSKNLGTNNRQATNDNTMNFNSPTKQYDNSSQEFHSDSIDGVLRNDSIGGGNLGRVNTADSMGIQAMSTSNNIHYRTTEGTKQSQHKQQQSIGEKLSLTGDADYMKMAPNLVTATINQSNNQTLQSDSAGQFSSFLDPKQYRTNPLLLDDDLLKQKNSKITPNSRQVDSYILQLGSSKQHGQDGGDQFNDQITVAKQQSNQFIQKNFLKIEDLQSYRQNMSTKHADQTSNFLQLQSQNHKSSTKKGVGQQILIEKQTYNGGFSMPQSVPLVKSHHSRNNSRPSSNIRSQKKTKNMGNKGSRSLVKKSSHAGSQPSLMSYQKNQMDQYDLHGLTEYPYNQQYLGPQQLSKQKRLITVGTLTNGHSDATLYKNRKNGTSSEEGYQNFQKTPPQKFLSSRSALIYSCKNLRKNGGQINDQLPPEYQNADKLRDSNYGSSGYFGAQKGYPPSDSEYSQILHGSLVTGASRIKKANLHKIDPGNFKYFNSRVAGQNQSSNLPANATGPSSQKDQQNQKNSQGYYKFIPKLTAKLLKNSQELRMRELKARENQRMQLMNMNLLQAEKFNGDHNVIQNRKEIKLAKQHKLNRIRSSPGKKQDPSDDFLQNQEKKNDRFDDLMADYHQQMLAAKQIEDAVASGVTSPAAAVVQFSANKGKQIEQELTNLEEAEQAQNDGNTSPLNDLVCGSERNSPCTLQKKRIKKKGGDKNELQVGSGLVDDNGPVVSDLYYAYNNFENIKKRGSTSSPKKLRALKAENKEVLLDAQVAALNLTNPWSLKRHMLSTFEEQRSFESPQQRRQPSISKSLNRTEKRPVKFLAPNSRSNNYSNFQREIRESAGMYTDYAKNLYQSVGQLSGSQRRPKSAKSIDVRGLRYKFRVQDIQKYTDQLKYGIFNWPVRYTSIGRRKPPLLQSQGKAKNDLLTREIHFDTLLKVLQETDWKETPLYEKFVQHGRWIGDDDAEIYSQVEIDYLSSTLHHMDRGEEFNRTEGQAIIQKHWGKTMLTLQKLMTMMNMMYYFEKIKFKFSKFTGDPELEGSGLKVDHLEKLLNRCKKLYDQIDSFMKIFKLVEVKQKRDEVREEEQEEYEHKELKKDLVLITRLSTTICLLLKEHPVLPLSFKFGQECLLEKLKREKDMLRRRITLARGDE